MLASFQKRFLSVFALVLTLAFVGCSSNPKNNQDGEGLDGAGNEGLTLELNGDSDSGKAGNLRTVYFDFDSSSLSSSTRKTLDANAAYLKENSNIDIQIEGHSDERGGIQYNLALGERRAKATKDYLVAKGISSSRVSIVSFGKERPVEFGHDESAWSKNRRANFVVTAK
ncbi:MAG: peptidoglycan-associated lipoprotein Pal [Bacteriovoracaceae bacterium]|nr:peptidoglycan-associated lipoprotein Pal [Bacteriovoracaceae bacterium]